MTGVHFFLHYGDLTDSTNLTQLISQIRPDEIYNLGAMSHVKVRFGRGPLVCVYVYKYMRAACWRAPRLCFVWMLLVYDLGAMLRRGSWVWTTCVRWPRRAGLEAWLVWKCV